MNSFLPSQKADTLLVALVLILVSFRSNAQNSGDIIIYIDSTAQTIRGFGAANIVDWYAQDLTMEDVERAYGNENGDLGFTILRLRISPRPEDWNNGNQIETARRAHELGALIWAAPWNPPASMYDPNSEQRKVDPAKYDLYAAHLDSFRVYMENNGVPIYAISVQNEPDYAEEWTAWEPDELVTFMREYAPIIKTRVMSPESFQFRKSYYDPILNDSLASAHTAIIGGHIYGGGISKYPLAEEKGKEIWMTEHYTSSDRSANIWPDALNVGVEMHHVMKANWNAYIWWQIKRYYSPIHDGVDADTDDFEDNANPGSITKRGYVMSQFARFVRPGDQRIDAIGPYGRNFLNVQITAYKDSTRNLKIVAVNSGSTDKEVTLKADGIRIENLNVYRTSEILNAAKLDSLPVNGSSLSISLPPYSITTYVGAYSEVQVSNELDAEIPNTVQLHQNFPNPFNPNTVISYQLPANSAVHLTVFDALGREVATLVDGVQAAGEHTAIFDASGLSSGVYFYQLKTPEFVSTKKMLLLK